MIKNSKKNSFGKVIGTLVVGAAVGLGISLAPAKSAAPILPANSNCVAYKTHKTLAMVASAEVVGTNCSITTKAVKAANGSLSAEILVPIARFDSHEHDREVWVQNALKASSQPNLIIRTTSLSPAQWQSLLKSGSGNVKGQVIIGGRAYPVSTTAHVKRAGGQVVVSGVIVTKFTAFGIQPPEVGPGGIIAKAPDYLELHYNLLSSRVQNMGVVPMK